jgi:toxin ParE1/3/4
MAQIIWDPVALDHLHGIAAYIAKDSPAAARRLVQRIFDRVERLEKFPLSGGYIAEDDRKIYREIIQGNYRVIYRVEEGKVLIVAVYHAARLLDRGLIP